MQLISHSRARPSLLKEFFLATIHLPKHEHTEPEEMITRPQPDAVAPAASPVRWLNLYGDFITKNASAVSQIESGLRSLTYLIPGMH